MRIKRIRPLKGGVAFFGSIEDAYRACLWSRVASRVLLVLDRIEAADADALYRGVQGIDWSRHLGVDAALAVHAYGVNDALRNTQFTAVKVKDAVCDQLREKRGKRPDVRPHRPDVLIDIALRATRATIAIDLSGEPLHRRAYRKEGAQSAAPLKENLAAAIVLESGWQQLAKEGSCFLDPMCGSGTLAIEAAMIAADEAPGILRDYWGFTGWALHDEDLWDRLIREADERFAFGIAKMPPILASDHGSFCIELAEGNAKRAGLADYIRFVVSDVSKIGELVEEGDGEGLLVVNPPYGERLGNSAEIKTLYAAFAKGVESLPDGWHMSVITPDEDIDSALGLVPSEKKFFYNGRIETELRRYSLNAGSRISIEVTVPSTGQVEKVPLLEENSAQFAARLKKVSKERKKWARREGISCYRVYDADLPDYAVAIDRYEGVGRFEGEDYLVIAEYRAPKTIDEQRARHRYSDALNLAPVILGVKPEHVFAKVRRRDKGGGQYRDERGTSFISHTQESGYTLEVDFGSYLDTGLFLDHRLTRQMVGTMAQGKRFLNLFAYTGTATVHAAGGGAASTTTVDLSQTYLNWAKRNMELNSFTGGQHEYIRADVIPWLDKEIDQAKEYDLIFVDPPTFSNSKSMGHQTWSVDRDYLVLLERVVKVLSPEGVAVFSCNLRDFKPDFVELDKVGVSLDDISLQSIPDDFKRNPKIHKCYLVKKAIAQQG